MEKQIVLRDIEWRVIGVPRLIMKAYCGGRLVAEVKPWTTEDFGQVQQRQDIFIFGAFIECTTYAVTSEAKARAEELLLEFLNSIAQPEDILTVKEKR